jgi:hypothetical protein
VPIAGAGLSHGLRGDDAVRKPISLAKVCCFLA